MSEVDVESQFWWEPCFTAFEEKLPLALRYTYKYFDVAMPSSIRNFFQQYGGDCDGLTTERRDSDIQSPTLCSSPRLLSRSKATFSTS